MTSQSLQAGPRVAGANQGLALIAVGTMPTLAIVSLVPNLPQLFQQFAGVPGHEWLVPMIITIPSLCIALFSPFAGMVADRFGRRRLLLWALALYGTAGVLPFFLTDLKTILVTRFGIGIAEAAILTTGNALMGDYFAGDSRRKWLGMQSTLGPIVAAGLVMSGGALGALRWQAPFLLYLLGLVVMFWVALVTWEPAATHRAETVRTEPATPFPWRSTVVVCIATIGVSIVYYVQAVQLGRMFGELGAGGPDRISWFVTAASLGVITGGWAFSRLGGLSIPQLVSLVFITEGIGYYGVSVSATAMAALPFGFVAQFANGLTLPVFLTWALGQYAFEHRGKGMGLWGSAFFIGTFISPPVVTLVGNWRGGFLPAVGSIGLAAIGIAILVVLLGRGQPAIRTQQEPV